MSVSVDIEDILDVVCDHYGATRAEIRSPRYGGPGKAPREIAIYLGSKLTALKFARIGEAVRRDHSSAARIAENMCARVAEDSEFRAEVEGLAIAACALAKLRRDGTIPAPEPIDPYEVAARVLKRGNRFAMRLSIVEIRALCEELLEWRDAATETESQRAPPTSPELLETPSAIPSAEPIALADLVHDLLSTETNYRRRPNAAQRAARDASLGKLKAYAGDPQVRAALDAHDFFIRSEFSMAERDAWRRYDGALEVLAKRFSQEIAQHG